MQSNTLKTAIVTTYEDLKWHRQTGDDLQAALAQNTLDDLLDQLSAVTLATRNKEESNGH